MSAVNNDELNKKLWAAVKAGNVEQIKALIDQGAEVNAVDKDGNNAMTLAYCNNTNQEAIIEALQHQRTQALKHSSTQAPRAYRSHPNCTNRYSRGYECLSKKQKRHQ